MRENEEKNVYFTKVLGKVVYTEKGDVIYTTQRYLSADTRTVLSLSVYSGEWRERKVIM